MQNKTGKLIKYHTFIQEKRHLCIIFLHKCRFLVTRTGAFAPLKENASVFRTRWVRPTEARSKKAQEISCAILLVTRTGLEAYYMNPESLYFQGL